MTTWLTSFLRLLLPLACLMANAYGHEGHGLEGSHAHPSDFWGLVALGLIAGLAAWLSRKK